MEYTNFILYVNDIALNEIGGEYFLDPPVEGLLDIPEIRTSAYNKSGQDGGSVPSQYYGMREIAFRGRIFSRDAQAAETARKQLISAIASKVVDVRVVTYTGASYRIRTNLTAFKCPIEQSRNKYRFNMQLLAPDPLLYDDIEDDLLATIARKQSGGYITPYVLPVVWQPATQPTNVINSGNYAIKPTIEFSGGVTNPRLTNITTGQYMQVNINTVNGDVLKIDMKNRQILLNGGSILALKETNATFFNLESGDNLLELTTGSDSDTGVALVRFRSGNIGA